LLNVYGWFYGKKTTVPSVLRSATEILVAPTSGIEDKFAILSHLVLVGCFIGKDL